MITTNVILVALALKSVSLVLLAHYDSPCMGGNRIHCVFHLGIVLVAFLGHRANHILVRFVLQARPVLVLVAG